jgi:hemerythrin
MDDVHAEIVDVVGRMLAAPDTQLAGLLDEVEAHAGLHFGAEIKSMRETDSPARSCHIDEHAAVLHSVHRIRRQVAGVDTLAVRRLVGSKGDMALNHPRGAGHADA